AFGPTRAEKDRETATIVAFSGLAAVLLLTSGAVVLRDTRNRRRTSGVS
ncbi:MAG: hypothetical protein HOV68_25165, partial [Streptomycetaceae bacterium]|nr:hypothetical protein [Streptomycetaceae bacterium]